MGWSGTDYSYMRVGRNRSIADCRRFVSSAAIEKRAERAELFIFKIDEDESCIYSRKP